MQPLTAPATGPAENIDDVLDRFQSWANTHKAAHKTRDMIEGVREVSRGGSAIEPPALAIT